MRQAGSGRGSSSLVPLARASAVGHYSYTTTIPPEFTTSVSVEEASAENVGPKKLEQLAVPEGHLQQLISELEVLSGSESAKPVIPISTVSLPMRYGKHRRRISFMKQKDGKRGTIKLLGKEPAGKEKSGTDFFSDQKRSVVNVSQFP